MSTASINPKRDLPIDEFGILGIGSFAMDAIVENLNGLDSKLAKLEKDYIRLKQGTGLRVLDAKGNTFLELMGKYRPDEGSPSNNVRIDVKHNSSSPLERAVAFQEFMIGKDVSLRPGGGIINMARSWIAHSSEIPIAVCVLRGEGRTDSLVDGAFFHYIPTQDKYDPANLVLPGRTIVRGNPPNFSNHLYFNPKLDFNIGTVVINSLDSTDLTSAGITFYNDQRKNGHYLGGVIGITPKMKGSYDTIKREAIPRGFIPVFSPTDLMAFVYGKMPEKWVREKSKNKKMPKVEEDLTYSEIFSALQEVRKMQGDNPQRIYVTLGSYGALGVGTGGKVFRTAVFNATGDNFTGAGDAFFSGISKFEHNRMLSRRQYLPAFAVMAYSSAIASLHIDRIAPSKAAIYNRVHSVQSLDYEVISPLNAINPDSAMMNRTLKEVGNQPITGKYDQIKIE